MYVVKKELDRSGIEASSCPKWEREWIQMKKACMVGLREMDMFLSESFYFSTNSSTECIIEGERRGGFEIGMWRV